MPGKAAHFLWCPVRSRRPLKMRGEIMIFLSGRTHNRSRSPKWLMEQDATAIEFIDSRVKFGKQACGLLRHYFESEKTRCSCTSKYIVLT